MIAAAGLLLAAVTAFTPPRLISGELPGLPAATVLGGGEVLVEATIDKSGAVTHPILLRNTPPYGQMVLDAIARWRFTPARAPGADDTDEIVDGPVLIAAVYRAPTVFNGPTLGTAPVDQSKASTETPYPVATPAPAFPPQAAFGGVVMLEVSLDEAGISRGVRTVRSNPAFDSAARDALAQWNFRGALLKGRPVASTAYVIFGFMPPVTGPAPPR